VAEPGATQRVEARVRALYGCRVEEVAVLHVAALWQRPGGDLHVLRIGEQSPRSDTDDFTLSLARARADAIVTTGRILRLEPRLTHELLGPTGLQADLREWRAQRLGRSEPARSAVLSSGRELDLDHPLLRAAGRPLILTSPAAVARLSGAARPRGIELLGLEPLDLRASLAALQARGARCISIEAGPRSALQLYEAPLAVDELMLSVYEEPDLPPAAQGAPFLAPERIAQLLPHVSAPTRSGGWRFERRTRAPA